MFIMVYYMLHYGKLKIRFTIYMLHYLLVKTVKIRFTTEEVYFFKTYIYSRRGFLRFSMSKLAPSAFPYALSGRTTQKVWLVGRCRSHFLVNAMVYGESKYLVGG